VAPNKLIAKMASEFQKPNGISIVYESELAERIWPLPCRRIHGIGPRMSARLEQLGIRSIGELARCERDWLVQQFGRSHGSWMYQAAWGWDDRPVVTESEPVSMSRETTFERDLHAVRDRAQLRELFTTLCEQLAADLQRHGYVGKTIGVKLRYDNFQRATRDQTIDGYTNDAALIRRTAGLCLKRAPLERRLRLLGVKVAGPGAQRFAGAHGGAGAAGRAIAVLAAGCSSSRLRTPARRAPASSPNWRCSTRLCALWCMSSICCRVGSSSPENCTSGCSVTTLTHHLPAAFFSSTRWPGRGSGRRGTCVCRRSPETTACDNSTARR
jgi:DNA polymerase-4